MQLIKLAHMDSRSFDMLAVMSPVRREATTEEIKQAYRSLSRKYHPDTMRFRTILPGSCNSMDDVRDQWERIKLSYEILSRPKMRKRYDRKEFMADPAAAVQRAAVDAAVKGAVNVGKGLGQGLFQVGAFAFQQLTKKPDPAAPANSETTKGNPGGRSSGKAMGEEKEAMGGVLPLSDQGSDEEVVVLTGRELPEVGAKAATSPAKSRKSGASKGFAKRKTKVQ